MKKLFYFGETVQGFDIPVLNERELRAGAGILLLFASIGFFNGFLLGNLFFIKIFIIGFFVDFIIRIFLNPKYSPTLILGRIMVQNQKPEYVGAAQKKFAWVLGLILATVMLIVLVIMHIMNIFVLLICFLCLFLLFFETAFGICIGCYLYNAFTKNKAKYCPGGICEIKKKEEIQKIQASQIIILGIFIIFIGILLITQSVESNICPGLSPQNISSPSSGCGLFK